MTHTNLQLHSGLAAMGLNLSDSTESQLLHYVSLIQEWNQKINLTGHRTIEKMIPYHLLDSLSIAPFLTGDCVADVGSGAGLPGVPLAIADPSRNYLLIDSRLKRVQFLRLVCRELKLNHVLPVWARAEDHQPTQAIQTVVARAVSQADKLIEFTEHLLIPGGQWLLMKGQDPSVEMKNQSFPFESVPLDVPQLEGKRHVLIIRKEM